PDYVYFDHSIHIAKGIGCQSCHGEVDRMPLMKKAHTLHMSFCLDCHTNPEKHMRPQSEIYKFRDIKPLTYNDGETASVHDGIHSPELLKQYNITAEQLIDCVICHR